MTLLLARSIRVAAASASLARPAAGVAAPSPRASASLPVRAQSVDAFTAARAPSSGGFADTRPSANPLGPAVQPPQLPAEIEAMSPAELKGFTGEQVLGMTRDQFRKFQEAVLKEDGPGVMALDPQVRKAILRKGFLLEILDMCRRQQEAHAFCAW